MIGTESEMPITETEAASQLTVRLHPFLHQVSGSTLMFKFDNHTICKPLLPKEYHFYKFLPDSLREFTARYKGSIEIKSEEESDGTVVFYAIVPPAKINSLNLASEDGYREGSPTHALDFLQEDEFTLKRSGSIEIDEDSLDCYDNPEDKLETGTRLNKRLALLIGGEHVKKPKFIMLENLVAKFGHPSILDLKMGTQTHGDDESDAKKAGKKRKAENSTTKELGVRLHGMQKYNACNGKFETLSKYDGLKFTAEEFRRVITNFLYDGVRQRREVIQPIYDRLCHFYQCVSQQDTFRFYSSSLLIIYEGQQSPSTPVRVDVRAIDFAHTINESSALQNDKTQVHKGPDKGYLLGIKTLIDMFGELLPKGS